MYLPDWFILLLMPETYVVGAIVLVAAIVGIVKAVKKKKKDE